MLSISAYLNRIGVTEPVAADRETLFRLQYAHLTHVPYDTLDIVRGVEFTLDIPDVYDKVVTRGRGGYCFELNGLFGWLLRGLGYPVTEYFGRFLRGEDPAVVPMRRHRVLRVTADGRDYICDVGVGSSCPLLPLLLEEGTEQTDGRACYRFTRRPFYGWVIEERKDGTWQPYYAFTEEPQAPVDFVAADYYCSHSPDSPFTASAMAALQTPDGRKTLSGREFRIFSGENVQTFTPQTEEAYLQALRDYFGINIG